MRDALARNAPGPVQAAGVSPRVTSLIWSASVRRRRRAAPPLAWLPPPHAWLRLASCPRWIRYQPTTFVCLLMGFPCFLLNVYLPMLSCHWLFPNRPASSAWARPQGGGLDLVGGGGCGIDLSAGGHDSRRGHFFVSQEGIYWIDHDTWQVCVSRSRNVYLTRKSVLPCHTKHSFLQEFRAPHSRFEHKSFSCLGGFVSLVLKCLWVILRATWFSFIHLCNLGRHVAQEIEWVGW